MAEKHQNWDPAHQPPQGQNLGTYQQQPGAAAPMSVNAPVGVVSAFPTANFCPASGGAHDPVEKAGAMGIIIGILFCPCGLIAIAFDKKVTCRNCHFVIKESWGGM